MKHRILIATLALLLAVSAHAQFLGDAMAAAGYAESEDVGWDALAQLSAGRAPRPSQNQSNPQYSQNVSTPDWHGSRPPAQPQPQQQQQPQVTSPEPYAPVGPLPEKGEVGFAGGGKTYSAEDAAAWKAAFRPVGTTVANPPDDSETVNGNWGTLKYSKGVFYKQQGAQWVVVPAPVGARVKDRPAAASLIVIHNASYLYYNGAFFVWNAEAKAADVVAPPPGAIVTYIPDTAAKQDRNGQPCYIYGGTCFKPTFRGANVVYVVS